MIYAFLAGMLVVEAPWPTSWGGFAWCVFDLSAAAGLLAYGRRR